MSGRAVRNRRSPTLHRRRELIRVRRRAARSVRVRNHRRDPL